MIVKNKMVFFNIAYMENYQGHWDTDKPVNGGSYISEEGYGEEVFNFQPYKGMMYGFVEPGRKFKDGPERKINISRLGGGGDLHTESSIPGVLIIWVARPPESDESVMVGWYENAELYPTRRKLEADQTRRRPGRLDADYFASAREADCQLLLVAKRTLTIPRGAGGFGHSNIWYAGGPQGEAIKGKVIAFINEWNESDENYQREVEAASPHPPPETAQKPKYADQRAHRVLTDAGIAKYCLNKSGFKCELDTNHTTFISEVTGKNYVEAHHLVPLKYQSNYELVALDNHANIIALCPTCHRLLHHATKAEKGAILKRLLNEERLSALCKLGIVVTVDDLFAYY